MKKIIFLLTFSLAVAGCGKNNSKNANAVVSNQSSADNKLPTSSGEGSNKAVNTAIPAQNSGKKIEQVSEINFQEGLPKDWEWIDPDGQFNPTNYETTGGRLRLEVPGDKDLFGESRAAPRLVKAVTGDFELETRVKFDPQENYQGAGILIFRNDNNYLRLERGFGGFGGGESGVRFDKREDEIYEPIATPEKFPTTAGEVELKIRRARNEFTAFWRVPGGDWKEVGKYSSNYPETVRVGLIACNTAQKITAEFAYLRLSPVTK